MGMFGILSPEDHYCPEKGTEKSSQNDQGTFPTWKAESFSTADGHHDMMNGMESEFSHTILNHGGWYHLVKLIGSNSGKIKSFHG